MTRGSGPTSVPRPVLAAALLTGGEAAGLGIVCALYLRAIVVGRPSDRPSALLGDAMGLALAALLAVLARGLARRRRPALTPVVMTQLLILPVSWGLYQGGQWGIAALMAMVAVTVLTLLFGSAAARGTFS